MSGPVMARVEEFVAETFAPLLVDTTTTFTATAAST